uniref:Transmembrane 6 superfamily member 1-like n=1 Tax=Phallusia mammillata TaxID=59560 RepID=A0A6F9DVU7_9ASCI|nr:transmembrane 6 superfamily member 1-like [Phallusia mammillata]
MVTSLVTLIVGAMSGSYGDEILPASCLNIPYGVLPIYYLLKFLTQPRHFPENRIYEKVKPNILDVLLALGLGIGLINNVIRGLGSLDSPFPLAQLYASEYEPYILHPTNFGKVWILFMLFVGRFLKIVLMFGLFQSNASWMLDWSIIYTAISVYGTYVHLIAQFCPGVEKMYQVPDEQTTFVIVVNLFLPVVALAVMLRSFLLVTKHKKIKR